MRFAVPTGNFGDIFAGYAALRMGLPIERLIIATNSNDILARTLATGIYQPRPVVATASPSMDIQVSSNFERLIFEASGRDSGRVKALMADFAETGAFTLSEAELAAMRAVFSACRVDEAQTASTIARLYRETGYLADPHTAVGLAAAIEHASRQLGPDDRAGDRASRQIPRRARKGCRSLAAQFPNRLEKALSGREEFASIDANAGSVRAFIRQRCRIPAIGALP